MTDLLALRRALLDVRRRLRRFLAALAAQIVAPAPPESPPSPSPRIHAGRNAVSASRSARRAAAASRRVPPPPLQPSNPSTFDLWQAAFSRPEFPLGALFPVWTADGVYLSRMIDACHRASWNSRNPCPN